MKLSQIQSEVKAPKGQFNSFGKYRYRSCEDIVEAVKPVLKHHGFALTLTDEVVEVGGRVYVKATATITDGKESHTATAFAREEETKKGMDASQITGTASSYARKYALNGLFAIDDTKDADTKAPEDNIPDDGELQILRNLVHSSTLTDAHKQAAFNAIDGCHDYTTYQKLRDKLENVQAGYNEVPNPSATDAKKHVNNIVNK